MNRRMLRRLLRILLKRLQIVLINIEIWLVKKDVKENADRVLKSSQRGK